MLRAALARALPFGFALALWTGNGSAPLDIARGALSTVEGPQTSEVKNPVEGQPTAIERGEYVYKRPCASCHGFDARGYRATDLTTGQFSRGTSDAQLYRVFTRGIPTTEMPATALDDDEVWALISYLRTLIVPTSNTAVRGNAEASRRIWTYQHQMPDLPGTNVNRGFAVLGNKLFMTTIDSHLVALDMKTGNVVWDSVIAERKSGYYATMAPLVVKNKIIVGIGGADQGTRGFIDAFDAETGKQSWRFWTVPGPGEPGNETWAGNSWEHGGGSTWLTGTYDPELNLLYWGTGKSGSRSARRGA